AVRSASRGAFAGAHGASPGSVRRGRRSGVPARALDLIRAAERVDELRRRSAPAHLPPHVHPPSVSLLLELERAHLRTGVLGGLEDRDGGRTCREVTGKPPFLGANPFRAAGRTD